MEAAVEELKEKLKGEDTARDPHRHREGRRRLAEAGPGHVRRRPGQAGRRPAAPPCRCREAKADDDVVDAEIVDDERKDGAA